MKRLLFLLCLFFTTPIFAQNVNGLVIDFNSHLPISNVQIISINGTVLTNGEGKFVLEKQKIGDKISLRLIGYETQEIILLVSMFREGLTVQLKSTAIDLNVVTIKGKRNYQVDSLRTRKEFAKEFNYKGLGINDMFVTINPEYKPPLALRKPNSTAAIATLNLAQIFSLFSKNKVAHSKLKETLLRDEGANYVDYIFSKSKVESITNLKGDSLQNFMQKYRPSVAEVKKMNEYELIVYIKKQYLEFIKP